MHGHEASENIIRIKLFLNNSSFVVNIFSSFELEFQNKVSNYIFTVSLVIYLFFSIWLAYSSTKFMVITTE